jgi:hypothetical protein
MVEILDVANTEAVITQVTNVKTGSVNDLLTPGRNPKTPDTKSKSPAATPLTAFIL